MSDFLRINRPRADKILGAIEIIEKSGTSQKALRAQYAEILGPVLDRIERLTEGRSGISPEDMEELRASAPGPIVLTGSHWNTTCDFAHNIPLKEAVNVMSILMTRIEQAIHEGDLK